MTETNNVPRDEYRGQTRPFEPATSTLFPASEAMTCIHATDPSARKFLSRSSSLTLACGW